ncbi:MAG: diguanylate cyclase [Oscillospiraceae bacterium]|jgi:diguanylate cyclase (GGDEF)-like protein|nr:diguanylate cyclase [Oscillospiraceae bacterium]
MGDLEKNSILIVDDEKLNLKVLLNILHTDYTIYTAKDGPTAIEMARENKPDLILLDIIMPEMTGYEVLTILKNGEDTRRVPVIFITGLDSKEEEEKGLAMEAADYIGKPFSPAIVKLRVRNQIQIVNQIRTIERLSRLDQLTGIPNRRSLDQQMVVDWGLSIREQLPLALLMMDVDKFKVYNDTYGHLQGDVVLQMVARTFAQALKRSGDFAARYGGEEFCVLLPNTDIEGALLIAEQIRKDVEDLIIPCSDGSTTKVTISIGAHSLIPTKEDSIPGLIEKADQALYAAKESGRNRVCRFTEGA